MIRNRAWPPDWLAVSGQRGSSPWRCTGCSSGVALQGARRHTPSVQTQAQVKARLDDEAVVDGEIETLPVELDGIPGAVWQMELHSLMPADVRVSLFERGARKCALLKFPRGGAEQAFEAFESALRTANEVSRELHQNAAQAVREARVGRDS